MSEVKRIGEELAPRIMWKTFYEQRDRACPNFKQLVASQVISMSREEWTQVNEEWDSITEEEELAILYTKLEQGDFEFIAKIEAAAEMELEDLHQNIADQLNVSSEKLDAIIKAAFTPSENEDKPKN